MRFAGRELIWLTIPTALLEGTELGSINSRRMFIGRSQWVLIWRFPTYRLPVPHGNSRRRENSGTVGSHSIALPPLQNSKSISRTCRSSSTAYRLRRPCRVAFRALVALPAADLGPVELLHGFQFLTSAACRAPPFKCTTDASSPLSPLGGFRRLPAGGRPAFRNLYSRLTVALGFRRFSSRARARVSLRPEYRLSQGVERMRIRARHQPGLAHHG